MMDGTLKSARRGLYYFGAIWNKGTDQLYVSAQLICALVFPHARLRFALRPRPHQRQVDWPDAIGADLSDDHEPQPQRRCLSDLIRENQELYNRFMTRTVPRILEHYWIDLKFIKIISHYKRIGYNINVLQQTACLVVNPITVGNFAFLFICTPVGRTLDSMMVPT